MRTPSSTAAAFRATAVACTAYTAEPGSSGEAALRLLGWRHCHGGHGGSRTARMPTGHH